MAGHGLYASCAIVQATRQSRFAKDHRILDEFPIGSKVLTNETGTLLAQDFPSSRLKLIPQDTVVSSNDFYEFQAIVDHKGNNGNYVYRVRWSGLDPHQDTWEPPNHFTDHSMIEKYWQRRQHNINKRQQTKYLRGLTSADALSVVS